MYAIQNVKYNNYAIQNDGPSFDATGSHIEASFHDDTLSRRAWRIEFVSGGQFVCVNKAAQFLFPLLKLRNRICDYKCNTCWELRHESTRTPVTILIFNRVPPTTY